MTLIEMLMALLILMVVSMALMQMQLTGMQVNLKNILRDEAVNIAEMQVNDLMSKPFDDLIATPSPVDETGIPRTIRSFSITFNPKKTITNLTSEAKQITISVGWSLRGQQYTHSVTTIKRKT